MFVSRNISSVCAVEMRTGRCDGLLHGRCFIVQSRRSLFRDQRSCTVLRYTKRRERRTRANSNSSPSSLWRERRHCSFLVARRLRSSCREAQRSTRALRDVYIPCWSRVHQPKQPELLARMYDRCFSTLVRVHEETFRLRRLNCSSYRTR